jgi:hypothetical protein
MLSAVCFALLSEPQSPAVAKLNVVVVGGGEGGGDGVGVGDEGKSCFAYANDVIIIAVIRAIIVNKDTIINMILSSRSVMTFVMGS